MSLPSWQSPPEGRARRWVTEPMRRLEDDRRLDGPARAVAATAATLLRSPGVRDGLRGAWFGHALHPVLTDFPLGAWMSASLLDFIGGRSAAGASRRLIGFGLLMTVPTAAAGLAEWQAADQRGPPGGCRPRRVQRHRRPPLLLLVAGPPPWASGPRCGPGGRRWRGGNRQRLLGGHLSLVRKVGTADPAFAAPTPVPEV